MARKRTTFRFPIDSNFRADWEDFIKHAETKRQTPSQLLQDIVLDYLDDEIGYKGNTSDEIYKATKEFLHSLKKNSNNKLNHLQNKFNKFLSETIFREGSFSITLVIL